jgi:putative endopeptidase
MILISATPRAGRRSLLTAMLVLMTMGLPLQAQAQAEARTVAEEATSSPALGFDPANFDTSVRPQDDFYQFANGTWLANTPIPADRASFGSFDALREESETALRELLEEAAADRSHAAGSDLQKVADYYRSYLDADRIESLGLDPLRAELDRISRVEDRAFLPAQLAHLQRLRVQTPFALFVGQDQRQSEAFDVQPGDGLYVAPEDRVKIW